MYITCLTVFVLCVLYTRVCVCCLYCLFFACGIRVTNRTHTHRRGLAPSQLSIFSVVFTFALLVACLFAFGLVCYVALCVCVAVGCSIRNCFLREELLSFNS